MMQKRELFRMILIQYFMCYTCTMLATVVFTNLQDPPETTVSVRYLWQAAIFSCCAGLPSLLYYSKEGLSRKQWWIRTAIHTVLLEAILMTAGYCIGMYRGTGGAAAFFVTILVVDLLVRLFTYLSDRLTADAINRALRERRRDVPSAEETGGNR